MSFLDRIRALPSCDPARYLPFRVDGRVVGMIPPGFARTLEDFPDVFRVTSGGVDLADGLRRPEDRTAAVGQALETLAERGLVPGWRDEPYPVGLSFDEPPLFTMERAAVALFGIRAYGVHVNGVVGSGAEAKMWIGRRSRDKGLAPGKLDQIVAGGQPAGLSLGDNLIKECSEEAAIPAAVAATAEAVGTISYCTDRPEGIRRDVLYLYDLYLPDDFKPRNTDGEVEAFYLWPMERVMETVRNTDAFKFNCALVVIDFLIWHGYIPPDHPQYMDLIHGLRR